MTRILRARAFALIGILVFVSTALNAALLPIPQHVALIQQSGGSIQSVTAAIQQYPQYAGYFAQVANQAGGKIEVSQAPDGRINITQRGRPAVRTGQQAAQSTGNAGTGAAGKAAAGTAVAGSSASAVGLAALAVVGGAAVAVTVAGQNGDDEDTDTPTVGQYDCVNVPELYLLDDCSGTIPHLPFTPTQEYNNVDLGVSDTGTYFTVLNPSGARPNAGSTARLHPYERIGADYAYALGLSGAGTKIAVLDGGIMTNHQELAGKVTLSKVSNPNSYDASRDEIGHGTHVSALAAGKKDGKGMHGVAYDANLFVGSYYMGRDRYDNFAEEIAVNKVDAWNNSWGYLPIRYIDGIEYNDLAGEVEITNMLDYAETQLTPQSAMANLFGGTAVDWRNFADAIQLYQTQAGKNGKGGVVVWSSSNYGQAYGEAYDALGTDPADLGRPFNYVDGADVSSALPLLFPELEGAWITVINATDAKTAEIFLGEAATNGVVTTKSADGSIVAVSATCGAAARFCLAADGVQVASAYGPRVNDYGNLTGTSMAGPQVAGAVAILREAFPNLSAKDLATRLFVTADNSVTGSGDGTAKFTAGNGVTLTHGYSNIFGHGFVDLAAALAPIGTATTSASATSAAQPMTDGSTSLGLSTALGAGSLASLGEAEFMMRDVMGAGFQTSLGRFSYDASDDFITDRIETWSRQAEKHAFQLSPHLSLALTTSGDRALAFQISSGVDLCINV